LEHAPNDILSAFTMHPFTTMHDWFADHPVTLATVAAVIVGAPLSVYDTEIKAFLRLPPQKIGVWILKARVAGNEARLVRLRRIADEPSYAIYILLIPAIMVVMLVVSILFQIYAVVSFPSEALARKGFENAISFCAACVAFVLWHTFRDFDTALQRADGTQKLESKIERLRTQLPQEPKPPPPVDFLKGD
jgi:hypothetical protein